MKRMTIQKLAVLYVVILSIPVCAAVGFSQAVTAWAQSAPIRRLNTIVIDAGHGGFDGGATSCTGVPESTINLQIALIMDDLLHLVGYDTVMIRTTDTAVHTEGSTIASRKVSDLKERVRICNQTENALLLSIHQNTFSDSRYYGPQVFYASNGDSLALASIVQKQLNATVAPNSKRAEKPAKTVYLLEHIACEGILVECGFLSNPSEEAKLRDRAYQQKLCCAIATAISEFFHRNS